MGVSAVSSFFKSPQDELVPLGEKKFSYREKEEDPHTQAVQGQTEVIREFSLNRKLTFVNVITKIQRFVDQNMYSFRAREELLEDLRGAYRTYEMYMEDPETGKERWIPFHTGKPAEVFVDEIAHFARRKPNTLPKRSDYVESMKKILSEIDPLFTPHRLKIWNLLLEREVDFATQSHPTVLDKKIEKEMGKGEEDDRFAILEMWLTRRGNPQVLSLVGVDINAKNKQGDTALIWASRMGRLEAVRLFLAAGAEVDLLGGCLDETALMYACCEGHIEVVRELLAAHANVNLVNKICGTALMYACKKGHVEMTRELLFAGADLYFITTKGYTALMVAVGQEKDDPEIVEMLIQAGAEVNRKDEKFQTALHWAATRGNSSAVRVLLANGAEVDARDENGWTALFWASQKDHVEMGRLLIQAKANVNGKSIRGITPLSLAVKKGNRAMADLLLSAGANSSSLLFARETLNQSDA